MEFHEDKVRYIYNKREEVKSVMYKLEIRIITARSHYSRVCEYKSSICFSIQ